jgi:hypothetical protein
MLNEPRSGVGVIVRPVSGREGLRRSDARRRSSASRRCSIPDRPTRGPKECRTGSLLEISADVSPPCRSVYIARPSLAVRSNLAPRGFGPKTRNTSITMLPTAPISVKIAPTTSGTTAKPLKSPDAIR